MRRLLVLLLVPSLALAATGQRAGVAVEADVSNRKVTSTGGTTARALKDWTVLLEDEINVKDPRFGAACNATSASSGTDDTAAIQAALNKARDSRIKKVRIPASTIISAPLVVYSGVWLEVDPAATVYWKTGASGNNLLVNRAVNTVQRSISDAAITAGSVTLTSATASFTSADVGRTVQIDGAGPGGGSTQCPNPVPLSADIATVTNGTTVTLSRAAKASVSGATARVYDRDSNIKITGGTWARGDALGGTLGLHSLRFRRVDGLTVTDVKVTSTAGKYAIWLGDVTSVNLQRIRFDTASDGVHIGGPASKVTVRDVSGKTGDDQVAITAVDWAASGFDDIGGDVTDVLVDGVMGNGNMAGFKLITGTNSIARNITVRNAVLAFPYGLSVGDDQTGPTDVDNMLIENVVLDYDSAGISSGPTYGRNLTVRNVSFAASGGPGPLIDLGNWESVVIDGVIRSEGIGGNPTLLTTRSGTSIRSLDVSNVRADLGPAATSANTLFSVAGNVDSLRLSGVSVTANNAITNNPIVAVAASSTVQNLLLSDVTGTYYSGTSASFSTSGIVSASGTVNVLVANNLRFNLGDTTNSNVLRIGGSLWSYALSNVHLTNGRSLIDVASGSNAGPGRLSNIALTSSGRLANIAANAELAAVNLTLSSLGGTAIYNTAALTLSGGSLSASNVTGAGTVTVVSSAVRPPYDTTMLTYAGNAGGSTYTIDATALGEGGTVQLVVNDGNPFTFAAPTNPVRGQTIRISIRATGTLTATSPFPTANGWRPSTWSAPASGNGKIYTWVYNGSIWYEASVSAATLN